MKELMEKLIARRKALELTQADVATMLGYKTKQHISNVERGESFSLELAIKIAKTYGMKRRTITELAKQASLDNVKKVVNDVYNDN